MKRKRSSTPYRIVRCRGQWFAWKRGHRLERWWPHVARFWTHDGRRWREESGVRGRTPFEALERLKLLEGKA